MQQARKLTVRNDANRVLTQVVLPEDVVAGGGGGGGEGGGGLKGED